MWTATTSTCSSRGREAARRYFPEVKFPPGRYVLDGELVIIDTDGREQFDALQNRLHPAESRVKMLAEQTPALFRAFDLLAEDRRKLTSKPFAERREALEKPIRRGRQAEEDGLRISGGDAADHLAEEDGALVAGRGRGRSASRRDLQARSAQGDGEGEAGADDRLRDRRVAPGKEEGTVGSLILGLYENGGRLRPIGHTSGLKAKEKRELVKTLKPFETGEKGSGDLESLGRRP